MTKKMTAVFLTFFLTFTFTFNRPVPVAMGKTIEPRIMTIEAVTEPVIDELVFLTSYERFQLMTEEAQRVAKEREEKIAREKEIERVTASNNRKNNVHFDPYNLLSVSNLTVEELNAIFIARGKPKMCEISNALIDAEKTFGVNALFLSGLVAQESGWTEKPGGDGDNLTGVGVWNPHEKGFTYGGSRYANIMETAKLLKNKYLTPSGDFYNGVSIWNVNTKYCLKPYSKETDYKWSENISSIANHLNSIYHNSVKTLEKLPV